MIQEATLRALGHRTSPTRFLDFICNERQLELKNQNMRPATTMSSAKMEDL